MESILNFACEHNFQAHLIIFICILLAGLNVPFSEDILVITGGALVSICQSTHIFPSYLWIFTACYLSAWEAYWIGRLLGPKLYDIKWFNRVLTPKRISRLHEYYEKFGLWTFVVGRFIPGGVRNALFMTSGLGKMPFSIFIMRDGIGCLLSTLFLYTLGYSFGKNYDVIIQYFKTYETIIMITVLTLITGWGSIILWRKTQQTSRN